ncbi:MAG: phage tail protein [Pseudomonadota bacterium]
MLDFDIEAGDLERIAEELGAMPKEIRASYNRALTRTASTLRKQSSKGLQSELGLRRAAAIRRRLKSIRVKGSSGSDYKRMAAVRLWYGLNDLAVSEFKGRVSESAGGAGFQGDRHHDFPGAFIAKPKGAKRRTILRRKGKQRLPIREEQLPIKDQADVFVEDKIFVNLEAIFWRHFRSDLERRVNYLRAQQ